MHQQIAAILPCNDLDATQTFFERLGFTLDADCPDDYRMMSDGRGGHIHLCPAIEGWLIPGRNPFGLYLYREDVAAVAAAFSEEIIEKEGPSHKPWGMYEFALNGPDDTLVRVGWPTKIE
ncbi:glyoxalase [Brucella anthropi]|uniref:glyoxalase n=1 Tax=Brucella anthropi TaxID=529 RepID=UPI00124C73B1|nr:glyoxalase [Brucella anthropi]KAB2770283.1 glyoxalase [Brucella anthropi]